MSDQWPCPDCRRAFASKLGLSQHRQAKHGAPDPLAAKRRAAQARVDSICRRPDALPDTGPNWQARCEVCDAFPTVGGLGLCGPCCSGEAELADALTVEVP